MIFDRFWKKKDKPSGNNESAMDNLDLTNKAPEVDDVLAEVDKALKKAEQLKQQTKPRGFCGC